MNIIKNKPQNLGIDEIKEEKVEDSTIFSQITKNELNIAAPDSFNGEPEDSVKQVKNTPNFFFFPPTSSKPNSPYLSTDNNDFLLFKKKSKKIKEQECSTHTPLNNRGRLIKYNEPYLIIQNNKNKFIKEQNNKSDVNEALTPKIIKSRKIDFNLGSKNRFFHYKFSDDINEKKNDKKSLNLKKGKYQNEKIRNNCNKDNNNLKLSKSRKEIYTEGNFKKKVLSSHRICLNQSQDKKYNNQNSENIPKKTKPILHSNFSYRNNRKNLRINIGSLKNIKENNDKNSKEKIINSRNKGEKNMYQNYSYKNYYIYDYNKTYYKSKNSDINNIGSINKNEYNKNENYELCHNRLNTEENKNYIKKNSFTLKRKIDNYMLNENIKNLKLIPKPNQNIKTKINAKIKKENYFPFINKDKIKDVHIKVEEEISNIFNNIPEDYKKDPEIHNKLELMLKNIKDIHKSINRKTKSAIKTSQNGDATPKNIDISKKKLFRSDNNDDEK